MIHTNATFTGLWSICLLTGPAIFLPVFSAVAADTTPHAQLSQWTAMAGRPSDVKRGQIFFNTRHDRDISCASCHGSVPVKPGKHLSTGKVLDPLAPGANPKAFTDTARINKWFRRNCNDVLGRECSAQEKADVIAFLSSLS